MTTVQKWMVGCGIGCGFLILVLAVLTAGGYFAVKNVVEQFEETESLADDVTEKYGRISEFSPDPDGAIQPERMEAFLTARETMVPAVEKIEKILAMLSEVKREGLSASRVGVLEAIGGGLGLVPGIAEFLSSRNNALLEVGMGMGEYYYIYVLAYYCWLGKSPADGPAFGLTGENNEDADEFAVRENRRETTLRQLHRRLLPMLRNQHSTLERRDDPQRSWESALSMEIEKMEADPFCLPWQDGFPEVTEASLRPFRERLENSYNAMCNPLEVVALRE